MAGFTPKDWIQVQFAEFHGEGDNLDSIIYRDPYLGRRHAGCRCGDECEIKRFSGLWREVIV